VAPFSDAQREDIGGVDGITQAKGQHRLAVAVALTTQCLYCI